MYTDAEILGNAIGPFLDCKGFLTGPRYMHKHIFSIITSGGHIQNVNIFPK